MSFKKMMIWCSLYKVMFQANVFPFLLRCRYYWDYFKTFIRCFRAFSFLYFFFFSLFSLLRFSYHWVLFGRSVIQKREINCYVPSFFLSLSLPLSFNLSFCWVFLHSASLPFFWTLKSKGTLLLLADLPARFSTSHSFPLEKFDKNTQTHACVYTD